MSRNGTDELVDMLRADGISLWLDPTGEVRFSPDTPSSRNIVNQCWRRIRNALRRELEWRRQRTRFYRNRGLTWRRERYDVFFRSYWRARDLKLTYEDAVLLAFLDARPLREPFKLFEEPLPEWLQEVTHT